MRRFYLPTLASFAREMIPRITVRGNLGPLLRIVALYFLAAPEASHSFANPIVVDDRRRPVAMLSENVIVTVGAGKSAVSGQFRFHQEAPLSSKQTHITVFVPVPLPDTLGLRRYRALYGLPRVEVAARRFSAVEWNDIRLDGSPEEVRLPRGWGTMLYVCDVPLRLLGRTFDVKVSYVQPHFRSEIVPYVPIRPARDKAACIVTFKAESGRELRQVSAFSVFSSPKSALQFIPKDRKLIRVQSVSSSAATLPRTCGRVRR